MAKILLGVGGGIAAYKSCYLVRLLRVQGHEVKVIQTKSSEEFVTKLTFESLSQNKVYQDLFSDDAFGTAHIELARWADVMIVAPCTASLLAKFANGLASDFLSTVFLAFRGRVHIAPAMNSIMWENPAVQSNLKILQDRGCVFHGPVQGELACGEEGLGKMMEPEQILSEVWADSESLKPSPLREKKVVITTGPTREYLDPVRFISSPSTGTMGFEIAKALIKKGAHVTLISGPTALSLSERNAKILNVETATEMAQRVQECLPCDIFIGAAAVADYSPVLVAREKLKKRSEVLSIDFQPTVDILKEVTKSKKVSDLVVGFAAETENFIENAKTKLLQKDLDLIVANEVNRGQRGFGSGKTSVAFISREGVIRECTNVPKDEIAYVLASLIEKMIA